MAEALRKRLYTEAYIVPRFIGSQSWSCLNFFAYFYRIHLKKCALLAVIKNNPGFCISEAAVSLLTHFEKYFQRKDLLALRTSMAHLRIALILCKHLISSRTFLCRFFCFVFVLILIYMYTYDPCTNLGKRKIQVDRMCPKNSDKCYNVQLGKMTLRKKEVFVRFMIYDDRAFGDETGVALRPPEGGKESSGRFRCSDIQKWPADHTTLTSSHVASMIASTFLLGSLSLEEMGVGKQVLEIGLGGGSFDMGLHKMKPHVNITVVEIEPVVAKLAYKWFGVVNSETHHTILQDGKEFLEQAYNQGAEFLWMCELNSHKPS
nr:Dsim\GD24273-PA [Haemonchus contortus]